MTYKEFIENIIETRGRFNCDGYKERHHIIPKCMGGTNNEDNLIDLYAEEHYIAHKLLAMENSDNFKIVYAWWRMNQRRSGKMEELKVSAENYALARKLHSEAMANREITDETRKKISERTRGSNNPMWGMFGEKNPCYGRKHTEEERQKMSDRHVDVAGEKNPMYGLRGDLSPHAKACYCVELDKTYGSVQSAEKDNNIGHGGVSNALRGKQNTSGKHPVTGEPLHWRWA